MGRPHAMVTNPMRGGGSGGSGAASQPDGSVATGDITASSDGSVATGDITASSAASCNLAPVDFVFDRNRSPVLTVTFMSAIIFVFFAFVVTGASRDITVAVNCTGMPASLLVYLVSLAVVPILSPAVLTNAPSLRKHSKPVLGASLAFLALLHLSFIRLALSTRQVRWDCAYSRSVARARGIPAGELVLFDSAQACIPGLSAGVIRSDGGPGDYRDAVFAATGWDQARCEAEGAAWGEHDEQLFLGHAQLDVPMGLAVALLVLLDVAYARLLLTRNNAESHRKRLDAAHTRALLKGEGKGKGEQAAGCRQTFASAGAGTGTGTQAGAGGGAAPRAGHTGTGTGGKSAAARHGAPRCDVRFSRGAVLMALCERLRPLFDTSDVEECRLLRKVAAATIAHMERGRRERREQCERQEAQQQRERAARTGRGRLAWLRRRPSAGSKQGRAAVPGSDAHLDALVHLPSPVWIAALTGFVTVVFLFQVAIDVTPHIEAAVQEAAAGLDTTARALENITLSLVPVVPGLCGGVVHGAQVEKAGNALAQFNNNGSSLALAHPSSGAAALLSSLLAELLGSAVLDAAADNSTGTDGQAAGTAAGAAAAAAAAGGGAITTVAPLGGGPRGTGLPRGGAAGMGAAAATAGAATMHRGVDAGSAGTGGAWQAGGLNSSATGGLVGPGGALARACVSLAPLAAVRDELERTSVQASWVSQLAASTGAYVPSAWVASNALAFLITAGLGATSPWRYREVQRALRMGGAAEMGRHRPFKMGQYKVTAANKYVGLHLGSCVFGYAVLVLTLTPLLTLLFSPDTWSGALTYANNLAPASLAITVIQLCLDQYVGNRQLSNGYWIRKPAAWGWFSAVCALPSVITGIVASIKRFAYLLVIALASVVTLDSTMFPPAFTSLDSGYSAFMAVAALQHRHRSPVLTTAREAVFSPGCPRAPPSDGTSAAALRARSRWQLAATLLNNPALTALRGHALRARTGAGAGAIGAEAGQGGSGQRDGAGGEKARLSLVTVREAEPDEAGDTLSAMT
eukprot:g3940.t1